MLKNWYYNWSGKFLLENVYLYWKQFIHRLDIMNILRNQVQRSYVTIFL